MAIEDFIGSEISRIAGEKAYLRRRNIRTNRTFLEKPQTLDRTLSEIGESFLDDSQLLSIDKELYKRDPLRALDDVIDDGDPRKGSLLKSREKITQFLLSDPKNHSVDPVYMLRQVLDHEASQTGKPQEATVFQSLGDAIPNALAKTFTSDVSGDLGYAFGTAAVTKGLQGLTTNKSLTGKFVRGINRTSQNASLLRKTAGGPIIKSLRALTKGAKFIPHPLARAAAGIIGTGLAFFETSRLVQGAVEGVDTVARRTGFKEDSPTATAVAKLGVSLLAPLGLAPQAKVRSVAGFFHKGRKDSADAALKKQADSSVDREAISALERLQTGNLQPGGAESILMKIPLSKVDRRATEVITDNLKTIRGLADKEAEAFVDMTSRLQSAKLPKSLQLDKILAKKKGPQGPIIAPESSVLKPRKLLPPRRSGPFNQEGPKIAGLLKPHPKVVPPRNKKESFQKFSQALRRDVQLTPEIRRGLMKARSVGDKFLQEVEQAPVEVAKKKIRTKVVKDRLQEKSFSAAEGPTVSYTSRRSFIQDDTVPLKTKEQFNASFSKFVQKGLSDEEATAKAFEEIAPQITATKSVPLAEVKPQEMESSVLKEFVQASPKKRRATERTDFKFMEFDEYEKALINGADDLGKPVSKLTDKDADNILRKAGLLGVATTVSVAALAAPDSAEAGVVDGAVRAVRKLAEGFGGKVSPKTTKEQQIDALINQHLERINQPPSSKDSVFNINSNTKVMNAATLIAKRKLNLELDKVTTEKASLDPLSYTFGGIFNNFSKMGKAGAMITAKFKAVDDLSEISLVRFEQELREALPLSNRFLDSVTSPSGAGPIRRRNLSKEEGKIIHDLLTGKISKARGDLTQTARNIRSVLDRVFQTAKKEGIPVVGYRKDYFPQILKEEALSTPAGRTKIVEHLLKKDPKTGKSQVSTFEEAVEVVASMSRDRFKHIFSTNSPLLKAGKLEKSRRFSMPEELYVGGDGNHILEALTVYASQAFQRIERKRFLGVNNEHLELLKKQLQKAFPDSKHYIDQSIEVLLGVKPGSATFRANPTFNKFVNFSRAIETIDLLGYAQISQLAQLTFTLTKVGPSNLAKGISSLIGKTSLKGQDRVDYIRSSAVVSQVMAKHVSEQFGAVTGAAQRLTTGALNAYLVLPTDRLGRFIAGSAGAEYTKNLVGKLGRKLTAKDRDLTIRQLEELGLNAEELAKRIRGKKIFDPEKILTDQELQVAIKRVSDMTQFRTRPGDLPLWFQSDYAKLITQFKSFLFQSGSAVNQLIINEFKQGNPKPLLTAGLSAPVVGHYIQQARDNLKENVAEVFDDPRLKSKVRERKRRLTKSGGGIFQEPRSLLGDKSFKEVFNDATYVLALGVMPDIVDDLFSGRSIKISSPTVDRVTRLVGASLDDLDKGRIDKLNKEFRRLTPLGVGERS